MGRALDRLHDERRQGVTGICFNMAIDRGLIDPDRADRDLLARIRAERQGGHPRPHGARPHRRHSVLTDDTMYPGGFYDFDAYIRALEVQHPLWQPGTRAAYHVHNQGFLLGEIMRRVTGMTVGPFLKRTSPSRSAPSTTSAAWTSSNRRMSPSAANTGARLFAAKDAAIPDKPDTPEGWQDGAVLRSFAFLQNPHEPWHTTMNSPIWRTCEIASGSGHGNARGVARIYGATVGVVDGRRPAIDGQLAR
jgi:hypothetical protein